MIIRPIGMRKLARFALAALFVGSSSTIAHAAITGTIVDLDGKPVAGATIRAFAPRGLCRDACAPRGGEDRSRAGRNGQIVGQRLVHDRPQVIACRRPRDRRAGHPRTTIATVDGDDIGVVQLGADRCEVSRDERRQTGRERDRRFRDSR